MDKISTIRILAVSGSLRARSINTSILQAVKLLAPESVRVTVFRGLGRFPLFNPDEEMNPYEPVTEFRKQIRESDGVLIASPEYAHGVTGVIKNALDWIVGSGELLHKPVAVLNASSRSVYAPAALKETLKVMDTMIVEEACITVPFIGREVTASDFVANTQTSAALRAVVHAMLKRMDENKRTTQE